MFVHQDARGQALVLAQSGRLLADEADAAADLAIDDLGRYRADLALVVARAVADLGGHADAEIVREYFGHLDLDLERAEIDHGQDRRIGGDVGALLHDQLADLAVDRRTHLELLDLALHVLGEQALAVEGQALALQFEGQAFDIELHVGFGIGDRDVGLGQGVLGAQQVHLGHGAGVVGALGALDFALGRLPVDHGLVEQLLGRQLLLAMVEAGPLHLDLEALARRLLLLQAVAQFGADDLGQDLVLGDLVARIDQQVDRARTRRIQGRADRSDHAALHRDVAGQGAALNLCDAQPAHARRGIRRKQARGRGHDQNQQDDGRRCGQADLEPALAVLGLDLDLPVLRRGVANHSCLHRQPPWLHP